MKSLGVVSPLRTMFIQERAECGMLRRQFVRRAVFAASIIAPEENYPVFTGSIVVVSVAHASHWVSLYRRRQPVFVYHIVDDDPSLHIPQQESRVLFGVHQFKALRDGKM